MDGLIRIFKRTDRIIVFSCLLISLVSVLCLFMICNGFLFSKRIFLVQIVASLIGMIIAFFVSSFDYHGIASLWKGYVPLTLFLVLLTFFVGTQRGGADDKAWIMLPMGMSIQPSEFLKISFVLSFSLHLSSVVNQINKLKNVVLLCLHGVVPVILIHMQGDDGTALIFLFIFVIMFFSAGVSWKYIVSAILLFFASLPVLWLGMNQDQRNRILITLHPENDQFGSGYQQFHSLISIGNGGFFGRGIFSENYKFVPEIQNDFIFSFIGQAFGFVGSLVVLGLLTNLLLRILFVALKSEDFLGRFICVGIFALFSTQLILNIGMNLSVLPVIGVTLPFLSSGGSSVITVYFGVGLVLSVFMYNNKTLFYQYRSIK